MRGSNQRVDRVRLGDRSGPERELPDKSYGHHGYVEARSDSLCLSHMGRLQGYHGRGTLR